MGQIQLSQTFLQFPEPFYYVDYSPSTHLYQCVLNDHHILLKLDHLTMDINAFRKLFLKTSDPILSLSVAAYIVPGNSLFSFGIQASQTPLPLYIINGGAFVHLLQGQTKHWYLVFLDQI